MNQTEHPVMQRVRAINELRKQNRELRDKVFTSKTFDEFADAKDRWNQTSWVVLNQEKAMGL